MKKVMLLLLLLLIPVGYGSATVEEVDIVNSFPDEESTDRGTQVVARFQSDSTTTFDANLYVQKPDGSTVMEMTKTLTVKSGSARETGFRIASTDVDQFGEYMLTLNQTDNNINDTFNFTITPQPMVDIEVGDLVKDPAEQNLDYVHVNVNPTVGRSLSGSDFHDANLSVYRITSNKTTPTGVQKELFTFVEPGISNETGDLEAVVDFTDAEEGTYEVFIEFNISSCASCDTFREVESTSIRVRDNDINAMSAAIAVILSLIFAGFLLAYIANGLDTRNKLIASLRVFLLMAAPLFVPIATFTGGQFAREAGFTAVASYMNYVFLGSFLMWFLYLFVIGFLFYMDETVRAYITGNRNEDL